MFKTLNLKKLILSFLIPFGVAFLSEILTKNAMEEYANLASPPLSLNGSGGRWRLGNNRSSHLP